MTQTHTHTDNLTATLATWWDNLKDKAHALEQRYSHKEPATTKHVHVTAAPPAKEPKQQAHHLPLGPFEATEGVLGEGGYAKVLLGRHVETGEKVAIKILDTRGDPASGRAASSESAVVREVAALRRAGQHPNVCGLLGYYRLNEHTHAMVMELCRGGELFRLVEKYGALDESKIRPVFVGVLEGVRHLHAQGIAHRDLKLENILLSDKASAVPKIVDLGLAHVHARGAEGEGWAERALTQFCGSRSYCAPEVMARLGYNGYAADVWSLGVCLFGLVAGFFPVDEASNRDWRYERIARHQHVSPAASTCELIFTFYERPCPFSPALKALLDRMLQVAPAKRCGLPDVLAAPWVLGHATLPPPPMSGGGMAAPPSVNLMDDTVPAAPAAMAPGAPGPAPEPSCAQIEIDLSEFLTRSAMEDVGDPADGDAPVPGSWTSPDALYRSAAGANAAHMPPRIRRCRGEDSVGMFDR